MAMSYESSANQVAGVVILDAVRQPQPATTEPEDRANFESKTTDGAQEERQRAHWVLSA